MKQIILITSLLSILSNNTFALSKPEACPNNFMLAYTQYDYVKLTKPKQFHLYKKSGSYGTSHEWSFSMSIIADDESDAILNARQIIKQVKWTGPYQQNNYWSCGSYQFDPNNKKAYIIVASTPSQEFNAKFDNE